MDARRENAAAGNSGAGKAFAQNTAVSPDRNCSTLQVSIEFLSSLGSTTTRALGGKPRFDRSRLPTPEGFWASHGVRLKAGSGAWRMANCPFHADAHASLGINMETGGFFCHACGAKGGDVLAAHRLLTGKGFIAAARELGAWEDDR